MKENPKTYPNIITYNSILDACIRANQMQEVYINLINNNYKNIFVFQGR